MLPWYVQTHLPGKWQLICQATVSCIPLSCPLMSSRGLNIEGEDESWDFGSSAGFYLNATQPKWKNYRSAPAHPGNSPSAALREVPFLLVLLSPWMAAASAMPLPAGLAWFRAASTNPSIAGPALTPIHTSYTPAGCMSTLLRSCQPHSSTCQSWTPRRSASLAISHAPAVRRGGAHPPLQSAHSCSGLLQQQSLPPAGINHGTFNGRAWRVDHWHQKSCQV